MLFPCLRLSRLGRAVIFQAKSSLAGALIRHADISSSPLAKLTEDDAVLPDGVILASHQMTFRRNLVALNMTVESYTRMFPSDLRLLLAATLPEQSRKIIATHSFCNGERSLAG